MVSQKQIVEIRSYLEKSSNPLFFFDDDQDGLAAFLLLKRKYQKGRGIPCKTRAGDTEFYVRKINELNPDLIVFLDRPVVDQEIIDAASCPVLWIDHHQPLKRDGVKYYNPMVISPGDNRPTSFWAYQIVQQDLWIALVGIIGDWHWVPELVEKFEQKELLGSAASPPEALFDEEFGILVKVFNFIMKGTSSDSRKHLNVLEKISSPFEILKQESPKGKFLWKKFSKVNKEYEELLKKALKEKSPDRFFVFSYPSGRYSFSSGLSNELLHRLDYDMFLIARQNEHDEMVCSLRGKSVDVLPLLQTVLKDVSGHGGGHLRACGAVIQRDDFQKFVDGLRREFKKL